MAFAFLSSDFFALPGLNSLPTPPATPIISTIPLPSSTGPQLLPPSGSSGTHTSTQLLRDSSSPAPTIASGRFYPKSFLYNTPINPNTFGAIPDPGYSSLNSRTANYYLPPSPATPAASESHAAPTPCETYLKCYDSGELETRKGKGDMWELQCIICDNWVKTSVPFRRPLAFPNYFVNLESHCASDKCVSRSTRASTAPPVLSPRKAHTPACSTNSVNQNDREDEEDNDDDEFEFQ
jgi:hypothetical protein